MENKNVSEGNFVQHVVKLTPEQIVEKEIQLFKTKMNLEMGILNMSQFQKAIDEHLPEKEAKNQINNMKKQIETLKHNIIALEEQISKGEM